MSVKPVLKHKKHFDISRKCCTFVVGRSLRASPRVVHRHRKTNIKKKCATHHEQHTLYINSPIFIS